MFHLNVEEKFSAAHQLMNYSGPCENLHGHTWKIRLTVEGTELDESGMLVDFRILKKLLHIIHDEFDHKLLNNVVSFSPTSEQLARYIYKKLEPQLPKHVRASSITIWESDTSSATYDPL